MPTSTRDGYKLLYWKNTSNSAQYTAGQSVTPSYSMNFIAVWEESTSYTITFKCASGENSCSEGAGLPRTCETDSSGKIDSECYNFISCLYYKR